MSHVLFHSRLMVEAEAASVSNATPLLWAAEMWWTDAPGDTRTETLGPALAAMSEKERGYSPFTSLNRYRAAPSEAAFSTNWR